MGNVCKSLRPGNHPFFKKNKTTTKLSLFSSLDLGINSCFTTLIDIFFLSFKSTKQFNHIDLNLFNRPRRWFCAVQLANFIVNASVCGMHNDHQLLEMGIL